MRYFRKSNGRVAAFDANQLTQSERYILIADMQAQVDSSDVSKKLSEAQNLFKQSEREFNSAEKVALEAAQFDYDSSPLFTELQRVQSIEVFIPDDAVEMTEAEIHAHLNSPISDEQLAATARTQRDALLEQFTWRYERHARETRLGIETTDTLSALDAYAQSLADVPQQDGFPTAIEWPQAPA